jgi:hypothetical protein
MHLAPAAARAAGELVTATRVRRVLRLVFAHLLQQQRQRRVHLLLRLKPNTRGAQGESDARRDRNLSARINTIPSTNASTETAGVALDAACTPDAVGARETRGDGG